MNTFNWKDVMMIVGAALSLAMSHFRNGNRISVLESKIQGFATHGDIEVINALLEAERSYNREMFGQIKTLLDRIDRKLDGKADKS